MGSSRGAEWAASAWIRAETWLCPAHVCKGQRWSGSIWKSPCTLGRQPLSPPGCLGLTGGPPLFSRAQVFDGRTLDSVWNGVHAYSGFGWAGEGLCPQRSPGVKACVKRRELAPRQAPHDAGRREGPRVGVPRGLRNKPEDDLAGGTIPSTPDASPRGEVTKRQRPSVWRARHRTAEQSAVWCRGSRGGYWGASAQQPKWPQCARGRRAVAPMRRRPAAQQSPQEHGEKLSSPSLPCPLLPSKGDAGCPPISLAVVPGAPRACD